MSGPAVILLGLMGAGKTSVGRALATRLDLPFSDLDAMIVERAGCAIPEIFEAEGEAGFRALEAEVLADALEGTEGVLALGGGAAMTPASRALLQGRPIVLLEIDEALAASRLGGGSGRPMLRGEDPMVRWRQLAAQREPVYRELARWRVRSGPGSAAAVARTITDLLGQELLVPDEEERA